MLPVRNTYVLHSASAGGFPCIVRLSTGCRSQHAVPTHADSPQIPVPEPGKYRVALDSDGWDYGGKGRVGWDVDHFTEVGCRVAVLCAVL